MFFKNYKNKLAAKEQEIASANAIIDALNRSTAIIEFYPSGEILTANNNFLSVTGYQLDEIVGKSHKIFVLPELRQSKEFNDFWAELASGQLIQKRFRRVKKSGDIIWLEASYNPVFNEKNQVVKVVKFATDITRQVIEEQESKAKTQAISKAMAVIEFDLQGQVLSANSNFCEATGYSVNEIVGKSHKLFVDPKYSQSNEYKLFWEDLAAGNHCTGTFKRFKKNGEEVWLEASYNPIFDANDKPFKVVKYAVDVGSNKNTRLLNQVVADATSVLRSFSQGDLTATMPSRLEKDEESMFRGAVEMLGEGFNQMSSQLSKVISAAVEASKVVSLAASEVADGATGLNERIQEQAAAAEQTSATMKQMTYAVQNANTYAQETSNLVHQVQLDSNKSAEVVASTVDAMGQLQESSHQIAEIVTLIDSIAFQTNLLALNAAVEAARAGDHGRGFAVVAGEVRTLAQESAEAAKSIRELIDVSVEGVNRGTDLVRDSGSAMQGVNQSIEEVASMISKIAAAFSEQSQGIHQINQSIIEIDKVNQQNSALVEETNSASVTLNEQSSILQQDMAYFKT